jgi:hypothetical protein
LFGEKSGYGRAIYPGRGNMNPKAIYGEHSQGEKNPFLQFGNLGNILKATNHPIRLPHS